jgi:hypothetical protein
MVRPVFLFFGFLLSLKFEILLMGQQVGIASLHVEYQIRPINCRDSDMTRESEKSLGQTDRPEQVLTVPVVPYQVPGTLNSYRYLLL